MRTLLFIVIVISTSSFGKLPLDGKIGIVKIQTKTYCDPCEKCESCWGRIENELRFTKGVRIMWFNDKTMIIMVEYNIKKTTPEKIREAIAKTGFDADSIKATIRISHRNCQIRE